MAHTPSQVPSLQSDLSLKGHNLDPACYFYSSHCPVAVAHNNHYPVEYNTVAARNSHYLMECSTVAVRSNHYPVECNSLVRNNHYPVECNHPVHNNYFLTADMSFAYHNPNFQNSYLAVTAPSEAV
jgi:hypothetical protein